ncbi:MAG: universal stress protein [Solirubrobacterales bacterium]|nr:universal stress protein [Solirubrobacterales bacterium]
MPWVAEDMDSTYPSDTETGVPVHDGDRPTAVVGLDGSRPSWDAFWWAAGEAQRTDGQIVAVFVSYVADMGLATTAVAGLDTSVYLASNDAAVRDRAAELQAAAAKAGAQLGVPVRFIHRQGDPADQLLAIARCVRADVIAVGRSTQLHHRIAGSLGRRLSNARDAPITVIVP